jgi:glycosyltransferase involved in cell wall biosynthesis
MSYAEGFGLGTLEAMMTGTPIIAAKTGGMTRQVVNHRDNTENGVALDIVTKSLVGSQNVPYIYEDYASCDDAAEGIFKIASMTKNEREKLSDKVLKYAIEEFSLQKTIDMWHETMFKTMKDFKKNLGKGNNFTVNEY